MSGISRKVDNLGRLCLPKSFRKELGINNRTQLDITMKNNKIVIEKKKIRACQQCNTKIDLKDNFCRNCGSKVQKVALIERKTK